MFSFPAPVSAPKPIPYTLHPDEVIANYQPFCLITSCTCLPQIGVSSPLLQVRVPSY